MARSPSLLPFFPALLLLHPAPAQEPLAMAVRDLEDPERREGAAALLAARGAAAVPHLRRLLARRKAPELPEPGAVRSALLVLAELGADAVPALPDVELVYRETTHQQVASAAAYALAELTIATGDHARCDEAVLLLRSFTAGPDEYWPVAFATTVLRLAPDPPPGQLIPRIEAGGIEAAAAAHAAMRGAKLDADVRRALIDTLADAMHQPPLPWWRSQRHDSAIGYVAAALHRHGERSEIVGRGLLQHWEPRQQLLGLVLLDAASISPEATWDVVRAAWHGDRYVRETAVATVQALGARSLVALRSLRALERHELERGRPLAAQGFARAAVRMLDDACRATTPSAASMLRHADAAVRDVPFDEAPVAADAEACRVLAEVVRGCRGAVDDVAVRLAHVARRRAVADLPEERAVHEAFVSLLDADAEAAFFVAVRALARLGPAAAASLGEVAPALLEARAPQGRRRHANVAFAAEAILLAGEGANADELRVALASPRWHVALRATVELQRRDALAPTDLPRLRELATTPLDPVRTDTSRAFALASETCRLWGSHPPHDAVQVAAAMALAAHGERPWQHSEALRKLLARRWRVDAEGLEAKVDATLASGGRTALWQLAQEAERTAWAEMRWPELP